MPEGSHKTVGRLIIFGELDADSALIKVLVAISFAGLLQLNYLRKPRVSDQLGDSLKLQLNYFFVRVDSHNKRNWINAFINDSLITSL